MDSPSRFPLHQGGRRRLLAVSAVPAEHLHRPLIVIIGDETVLDETWVSIDTSWCPWCEEAEAPTYLAHGGHDSECPCNTRARPRPPPSEL